MPDLGKYAFEVTFAYASSFTLLALLIGFVWWRSAKTRRALKEVEMRREQSKGRDV